MAQKYLTAFDYVDYHANSLLKKHAQKRPLGDIETKHRYTPTQPVLSCRTVDIDVSGTRTYRPKSSADIINEQHALIHKIYTKARNISSAPLRRSKTPRKSTSDTAGHNKENNLKSVEVQGRPLTFHSPRSSSNLTVQSSYKSKRPKTTGQIKSNKTSHDNFMVVHVDNDLLETRRSHRSITNKIHRHWEPENHDLNTGTYQRGKKPPGVPTIDSWLMFSGSQTEESQGLVDAFADLDAAAGEYYNVEGTVGSRIALQLQKGDKIRIGINGNIQSQDLKVKKWIKEDSYVKPSETETAESGKENMAKNGNMVIPLSWDDQVDSPDAKVMTPREPPTDKQKQNTSITRPVIFTKLVPDEQSSVPDSAQLQKQKDGFRVKQRKKTKPCIDGKERENKVTNVTIDSKTEEEELKIENLTIEEVIKQNVAGKQTDKEKIHHEEGEKHSVTFSLNEMDGALETSSKISKGEILSGSGYYQKHPKVKPSQPTFNTKYQEVELDIIGALSVPHNQRPLSNESDINSPVFGQRSPYASRSVPVRTGSARSSRSGIKSARSMQRSLGSSSAGSLTGYRPSEAEYIQIATPVKNPNLSHQWKKTADSQQQDVSNDGARSQVAYAGIQEPVPSPELETNSDVNKGPVPPTVQIKSVSKFAAQPLSINIPTADYTDSALNSPTRGAGNDSTPQTKRAKDMRDEQIDQITSLLVDAIIGKNEDHTS